MLRKRSVAKRSEVVTAAVCETLEGRWLLATYFVPPGNTAAYLDNGPFPGQVVIRLNSPTADPVPGDPFGATTGQHVLDAGTNGTAQNPFLVVDRVWARWKPQAFSGDPEGIKVIASDGHATLRIESNNVPPNPSVPGDTGEFWDRQYIVSPSTSSNTRIEGYNYSTGEAGETHIGTGVSNLIIRTNDVQASSHFTFDPPQTNPGTRVEVPGLDQDIRLTVITGEATYTTVFLGSGSGFVTDATVITGAGHGIVDVRGILAGESTVLVDYGDGSGLQNNLLEVRELSTVTLAQEPDSDEHVVVVEEVNVTGGGDDNKIATLIVAHPSHIDDLQVFQRGQAIVLPTANDTTIPLFEVKFGGGASIQGKSTIGLFTVDGVVDFTTTSAPSTVDTFEVSTQRVEDAPGVVNIGTEIANEAKVTALNSSRIGALNIEIDAEFTLQQRPQPPAPGNGRVLSVKSVFIKKAPNMPFGILDLKDNAMIIDYDGSSPLDETRQYIKHAYNGGAWDADGITTSLGDSSTYALGYAENNGNSSETGGVGYTEFAGEDVDGSSVLVRFTYYGDANLDGTVNLQDFNRLAANFGGSGKVWGQGEFNHDQNRLVNLPDFNKLAANFGNTDLGDAAGVVDEYTYEELEEMLPD